jgi:hypothetical protein
MPYKVLDIEKFKYADKLRNRKTPKANHTAIILVDSSCNIQFIPADATLTTPMTPRVNFWEIHLKKDGQYGQYGEKNIEKLAKRLDAVAFMCYK